VAVSQSAFRKANLLQAESLTHPSSHVFRDLKAYVCTFDSDLCDGKLFEDPNAWFEHEVKNHRALYGCMLCDGFGRQPWTTFKDHMSAKHGISDEEKLRIIKEAGRQPETHFRTTDCPFCDDWALRLSEEEANGGFSTAPEATWVRAEQFQRHVANHQEKLATFALLDLFETKSKDGKLSGESSLPQSQKSEPNRSGIKAQDIKSRRKTGTRSAQEPANLWNCVSAIANLLL
jgi:hypothetical protein